MRTVSRFTEVDAGVVEQPAIAVHEYEAGTAELVHTATAWAAGSALRRPARGVVLQHRRHIPVNPHGIPFADRLLNAIGQDVQHVRVCTRVAIECKLDHFSDESGLSRTATSPPGAEGAVLGVSIAAGCSLAMPVLGTDGCCWAPRCARRRSSTPRTRRATQRS
jgi:hypothetical protein